MIIIFKIIQYIFKGSLNIITELLIIIIMQGL